MLLGKSVKQKIMSAAYDRRGMRSSCSGIILTMVVNAPMLFVEELWESLLPVGGRNNSEVGGRGADKNGHSMSIRELRAGA